ncbi:MAG: DegV family protein [Oscillospiraceae bacterium]|nr:DegV family protein [Oscillospiraceae bacterium]
MEKIMFFSDSPADLLPEDTQGLPYRMVPSSVIFSDGRVELETNVDRQEYYEYLKTCAEIPTHAMGTPEQWLEAFEDALRGGYTHAVVCTISSTASSVAQSITVAHQELEGKYPGALTVEVIDSRQYSMIYGRLILESLEQAGQGWSFQRIVEDLRERTRRNQGIFGAYSLRCMQKSGRISGMAAFVGGALGIRPILLCRDGKIAPVEKVRGGKNVVPAIIAQLRQRIVRSEEQDLYLIHGSVPPEELDRLEALLIQTLKPKSVRRHTIGVTVITNCGPESVAVCYYGEPY